MQIKSILKYFVIELISGKPPTGRLGLISIRSPTSGNLSSCSNRSPLSRSTGNLLYSKSPNSLKRTDSAQSIRKEGSNNNGGQQQSNTPSSLSTNNSRSSTSSSIPMPTTPKSSISAANTITTYPVSRNNSPSWRAKQSSPIPKPKRDSLSSRVKHIDIATRNYNLSSQQQQQQQHQQGNLVADNINVTPSEIESGTIGGNIISSTPKSATGSSCNTNSNNCKDNRSTSSPLTSNWKRDLQHLNNSSSFSHSTQHFMRKTNVATIASTNNSNNYGYNMGGNMIPITTSVVRRFSSASVNAARMANIRSTDIAELNISNNNNSNSNSNSNYNHGNSSILTSTSTVSATTSTAATTPTTLTATGNSSGVALSVSGLSGLGNGSGIASDSDSGKVRTIKSTFLGWLNKI